MRRLLTVLIIILVVLLAGLTALVVLINPNDFRAYMIKQVEQKSGYCLTLDGELRWHIWPQLSILAGRMTMTAPGAKMPLVVADNMRLDVALLPLISHQLQIKQVLLKNAVLRLTPDSQQQTVKGAPMGPKGDVLEEAAAQWKYNADKLQLVDSLLIWQQDDGEQINVRDFNMNLQRSGVNQAQVTVASKISRDQRELRFNLQADVTFEPDTQHITAKIHDANYQLNGADIPSNGIYGIANADIIYQSPGHIAVNQLQISANDNQFIGEGTLDLAQRPNYKIKLHTTNLNLDTLLGWKAAGEMLQKPSEVMAAPVIADQANVAVNNLALLKEFNAVVLLTAEQAIYRDMEIKQLALSANNQNGLLNVEQLAGKLNEGSFSLPLKIDATQKAPVIYIEPHLEKIEVKELLKSFALPTVISGKLSMQGKLSSYQMVNDNLKFPWKGNMQLTIDQARLDNFNIQQLIQQTITRSESHIRGQESYPRYTDIDSIQAQLSLDNGVLTFDNLQAISPLLNIAGHGKIEFLAKNCDLLLNVRVLNGWQGDEKLVAKFKETPIPLRIYGSWKQLHYQLQVDSVLRQLYKKQAESIFSKLIEKE